MKRKLFAGVPIRALRESRGLSQLDLARRVGVSASYLSQIEANQRPLSASILLELARVLRVDVSEFSDSESDRLAIALREVLDDPLFAGEEIAAREIKDAALNVPHLAKAVLELHASYRRLDEKYRSLDGAIEANEGGLGGTNLSAFDEVRDFFHFIGNYVEPLDRAAEELAATLAIPQGSAFDALRALLKRAYGFEVLVAPMAEAAQFVSGLDRERKVIALEGTLPAATQTFALARYIAALGSADIIDGVILGAGFRRPDSAAVCRASLTNYFAGALLMPYRAFQDQARRQRYDIERLAGQFGVSLEQVCHRLSTLQRPGAEGIPFYFLRVDRAGNITKRHSATRFQFARYGGACPLWNIHEAFEMPDRFLIQVAEMPDGVRYLSLAHAINKGGGRFDAQRRRYAIGLGCELQYAGELVYSDAIDLRNPAQVAKIGVSCRLCERPDCQQRAMPPAGRRVSVDLARWHAVPYGIE